MVSVAGGKLNGALLWTGLVDEVNVIFRPELIGGTETPALFDATDLKMNEFPTQLKLITAQVNVSGYLWLRYEVLRMVKGAIP